MITIVVSAAELERDDLSIEGATYRHLFRARRLASDSSLRVVDGQGRARFGRVLEIGASSARVTLDERAPTNESVKRVELLAAVPKPSRLSWMVEKCTETGVSAIRLIATHRGPRRVGSANLRRLERVAVAAVEQCHRSLVPAVTGIHSFDEVPQLMQSTTERWFLQPGVQSPGCHPAAAAATLLVGPEGGWTDEESEQLSSWGCVPLPLGSRVLRVETAAVIGSASLLMREIFK